jgi:hypothetical protein
MGFEYSQFMKSRLPSQFYKMCLMVCLAMGVALLFTRFANLPSSKNSTNREPVSTESMLRPARNPKPSPVLPSTNLVITREPSLSDSDEELLRIAREWMGQSPEQTMARAVAVSDPLLRERFLFAALRAWGEKNPNAAVGWALEQNEEMRFKRMEAALTGAAQQPAIALEIGRRLLADDPITGSAYGTALIGALNAAGQFQAALQFANEGPPDSRTHWLEVTFTRWAQNRPQDAVKALDLIQDESSRTQAFQSLADGWSASNPSALAGYAISLPEGKDRAYAWSKAIDNWSLQDPAGLANWLNTLPRGEEFDAAAAMMITKTDGVNRTPQVALQWVENISDLNLKYDSLMRVLGQWNQTDPVAPQQYVLNTSWLDKQQQQELLKSLQSPPPNISGGDDE